MRQIESYRTVRSDHLAALNFSASLLFECGGGARRKRRGGFARWLPGLVCGFDLFFFTEGVRLRIPNDWLHPVDDIESLAGMLAPGNEFESRSHANQSTNRR